MVKFKFAQNNGNDKNVFQFDANACSKNRVMKIKGSKVVSLIHTIDKVW
jgi:hypothetical protein